MTSTTTTSTVMIEWIARYSGLILWTAFSMQYKLNPVLFWDLLPFVLSNLLTLVTVSVTLFYYPQWTLWILGGVEERTVDAPLVVSRTIIALLVVMMTSYGWFIHRPLTQKRQLYQSYIQRVVQERHAKQFDVLIAKTDSIPDSPNNDEVDAVKIRSMSVTETVHWMEGLIAANPFVPLEQQQQHCRIEDAIRKHVAVLARQCRNVGRDQCNAVAEELYDVAYKQICQQVTAMKLKAVDDTKTSASVQDSSSSRKVLLGVPISIKECLSVQGCYSTGGLACRLRQRCSRDSLVVTTLREAGAVPLVTGNVVQTLMLFETVNAIYGRTVHPWNPARTPGGSSGGDATLVATGCVPLALTSDVAGSIRIPAAFCGIIGFKPTPSRISLIGNMRPRRNNKAGTGIAIPTALGPMARTVDDCALFLKAIWGTSTINPTLMFREDPNVVPIPFNEEIYQSLRRGNAATAPISTSTDKNMFPTNRSLRIGYFDSDQWFEPCETSKRAVREAVQALQAAGHECVPFTPPTTGWDHYATLLAINASDGNMRSIVEGLEGEPMISEFNLLRFSANIPNWLRPLLCRSVLDHRRAHLLQQARSGGLLAYDLWMLAADLMALANTWAHALQEQNVIALIFPAMPIPAIPHGWSGSLTAVCSYMFLANLLQWPSGVVPVTTVRSDEAVYYADHELPPLQRDGWSRAVAEHVMPGSQGLPMAVSIMTPRYQDELCLAIMQCIEEHIPFWAAEDHGMSRKRKTAHGDTEGSK